MATIKIRKIVTIVEETRIEIGEKVDPPTRQCAAVAVIANPYAGFYSKDLTDLEIAGKELGETLGRRAMGALGVTAAEVHTCSAVPSVYIGIVYQNRTDLVPTRDP